MGYLRGSAIKIISKPSITASTTMTVESITDPDGTEVVTNAAMTQETVNSNTRSFYVWQSTTGNIKGRYKYITKAVNGIYTDRERGYLNLEED